MPAANKGFPQHWLDKLSSTFYRYKRVNFPNMILWKSDIEHMMPFLRNKPDLEKAINSYIDKYKF
jgi:hypothetical protein